MKKIIISSVSLNGVIGSDGKIPWHSKSDLEHFRKTTLNHPIIMGRITFDSIKKTLDKRVNIVLSRKSETATDYPSDIIHFKDISSAYEHCEEEKYEKVYIIGGAEVFRQTINDVDELIISKMKVSVQGDRYFPEIDENIWRLKSSDNYDEFELQKYVKAP